MSKDLLTHVLVFVTFRKNFNVHAQKCYKEKTLWENQKKNKIMHKSSALSKIVSCSKICERNQQK